MLKINKDVQSELILSIIEELVPQESVFRKIDKYIDFNFIYDEVKDLYCLDNGRPSIDPVVLFKLVFIQTLNGIKSMRKTCEKIKVDVEYRWFLVFHSDIKHHIFQHSARIMKENSKMRIYLKKYSVILLNRQSDII